MGEKGVLVTMQVIRARNVHQMLPEAMYQMRLKGTQRESRNGPVLQNPQPVSSVYQKPTERVEFHSERDANPFFHFMESLWMLGGRQDVAWISQFNSGMQRYSDDGKNFHGAYGYRWRKFFGEDQLSQIIANLKKNPDDRRQVLQMWSAAEDLSNTDCKDLPCNLLCVFGISPSGKLDMIVYNRSNDIVWGCYGANAVHFSVLQEYMARAVEVPVGVYTQVSFNWHLYLDQHATLMYELANRAPHPLVSANCPYSKKEVSPFPLMSTPPAVWQNDLDMFLCEGTRVGGYKDPFFRRVALPALVAWEEFKSSDSFERFQLAQDQLNLISATDWRLAMSQWLGRRQDKWQSKHT